MQPLFLCIWGQPLSLGIWGLQNMQEDHRMDRQEDGVKGVVGSWAGARSTVWLGCRTLTTGCC